MRQVRQEEIWVEHDDEPQGLVIDGTARCTRCERVLVGQEELLCTPCYKLLHPNDFDGWF